MFSISELAIGRFETLLVEQAPQCLDSLSPRHEHIVRTVARTALARIARSDALYHDLSHTIAAVLAGVEILHGKQIRVGGVTSEDWLHLCVALLCHDIGYVRGVCRRDEPPYYVVDAAGATVSLPPGASDAALSRYHVERGKIFARERLVEFPELDLDRITAAIEATRFPATDDSLSKDPGSEASLVRAADLIGQLGDPDYLRKANALYHEFVEAGIAAEKGYRSPADLTSKYPAFYWQMIRPSLTVALGYLSMTPRGRQWIAGLSVHVFTEEHEEPRSGPER